MQTMTVTIQVPRLDRRSPALVSLAKVMTASATPICVSMPRVMIIRKKITEQNWAWHRERLGEERQECQSFESFK